MILKLNKEKFNSKVKQELKEKMAKERSSMYLGVVTSLIAMLIGCIVSYAAYLYFGINNPTNLFCFILGIAVFCLGFNRLFEGIGDYHSKIEYAKYKVNVYEAYGVAFGSKTPEREIIFENGVFTEKSTFGFGEDGVITLVEAKNILRVYVLADHSAMLLVTPDLLHPCILLSDAFDGFNCSEIINEIKKYNEGVFVKQLIPTFKVKQLEYFEVQSFSAIVNTNIEDWVSVIFNDSIEDYVDDAPVSESKEEVKSESSEEKEEKSVENTETVQTETKAGNYTYAEKSEDEKPEEEKEEKAEVKKDDSTESTPAEEIKEDSEDEVENKEVDSVNN